MSGPAVFPVAVRMVYQVRKAVDVPIIGMGGIRNGRDIVEMMLAGADAVAMGTVMFADPMAPVKALEELKDYMQKHGIEKGNRAYRVRLEYEYNHIFNTSCRGRGQCIPQDVMVYMMHF